MIFKVKIKKENLYRKELSNVNKKKTWLDYKKIGYIQKN